MKENIKIDGKVISLSENENQTELNAKVLVCTLDEANLNGIGIKKQDALKDNQYLTLNSQPAVAKVIVNDDDELDFSGHNAKKIIVQDENGNSVKKLVFDTVPFGVFTSTDIEDIEIDGVTKSCIVANVSFWLRYENFIEVVQRLFSEDNLHVSWEISYTDYIIEGNVKWLTSFYFIGVAFLGSNVLPAYPEAGVIEISEFNKEEMEVSEALKKDLIKNNEILTSAIDQDKVGKGDKLSIDLTKDNASNKTWSDVNQDNVMQQLMYCSNYKTATKKGYLVREDGWETASSEHLKYPVVEIVDDTMVLNINGCQSARSRLMANDPNNTTAVNMLKKYYNILDLTWDEDSSTEDSQCNDKDEKKDNNSEQSELNINENIQGGNKTMAENKEKQSMASITNNDLYGKLWDAINASDRNNYYYIAYVFPYEYKAYAYTWESDDTSFIEFTYTVNSDDTVSITERKDVKMQFVPSTDTENVQSQLSEKDTKIAELSKELSEKVDALTKVAEESKAKDTQIAELTPFKAQVEKAEADKKEAELAEKREQLKTYATKGGYIKKEELETSEEIKSAIAEVDEAKIKGIIADRIIAELDKKDSKDSKTETSESQVETSATKNLNTDNEGVLSKNDKLGIMASYLQNN